MYMKSRHLRRPKFVKGFLRETSLLITDTSGETLRGYLVGRKNCKSLGDGCKIPDSGVLTVDGGHVP